MITVKMTIKTSRPPTPAVIDMIIVQFCSLSSAQQSFGYMCDYMIMFEKSGCTEHYDKLRRSQG